MEEDGPNCGDDGMVPAAWSDADKCIVRECLRAAADGPFFPDWEFHALFGLTREEVSRIAGDWPDLDLTDRDFRLALKNAINNLLGYPHGQERKWSNFISISPDELLHWWEEWRHHIGVAPLE